MKRLALSASSFPLGLCLIIPAFLGLSHPAQASSFNLSQKPPVLLDGYSLDPWVMQIKPGSLRPRPAEAPARLNPVYRVKQVLSTSNSKPATKHTTSNSARSARKIEPRFLPSVVEYHGNQKAGTIIINTQERYLYLVGRDGTARRYGVGVGRPGFQWAGTHKITRKAEWPGWTPPPEMRLRQPGLPLYMEGGPRNPLGARAMYIGSTMYRIHGSNEPWSIGHAVSSGCIRMRNQDVTDLYERVKVGTRVVVI